MGRLLCVIWIMFVLTVAWAFEPIRVLKGPFPTVDIIDGDTIKIRLGGSVETIRLIGIDTPETVAPGQPVEPHGPEASAYMRRLVGGREVWLEIGVEERDQYGRLLAYAYIEHPNGAWVWNGRRFAQVNRQLALAGFADLLTISPNVQYADIYVDAVQEARNAGRGMWSEGPGGRVLYDPDGPDRDCGDFDQRRDAQAFFEAAGGPSVDPHRLDQDNDGRVCESLPW